MLHDLFFSACYADGTEVSDIEQTSSCMLSVETFPSLTINENPFYSNRLSSYIVVFIFLLIYIFFFLFPFVKTEFWNY